MRGWGGSRNPRKVASAGSGEHGRQLRAGVQVWTGSEIEPYDVFLGNTEWVDVGRREEEGGVASRRHQGLGHEEQLDDPEQPLLWFLPPSESRAGQVRNRY